MPDGSDRACAANVIRVVETYRIHDDDTTYKVEIIMLWAYDVHIWAR